MTKTHFNLLTHLKILLRWVTTLFNIDALSKTENAE